jgi:zinc protease
MNPDNRQKVETAIREELELILAKGITEAELNSARKGYLENQKVDFSNDSALVRYLTATLNEGRDMLFFAKLDENLQNLTPELVHQALKKHLSLERLAIAVAGDFQRTAKP